VTASLATPGVDRPLTVLHIATLNKPITPHLGYGPIETVIGNIHKGLTALGHHSVVACSGDSIVAGRTHTTVARSLGDYCRGGTTDAQATVALHLSKALARATRGDIDIVHMHEWLEHVDDGSFNPLLPIVMTLHVPASDSGFARRALPTLTPAAIHFAAISDYQRRQYADLVPIAKIVPHGLDLAGSPFQGEVDAASYLFSIARITRVKGQDTAIEVARASGSKLILAGCVQDKPDDRVFFEEIKRRVDLVVDVSRHPVDDAYYDKVMKPILSGDRQIIYIGEVDVAAKKHWYRHAKATLFPVRWGEPFGMVLIESMACGTPVIAFGEGAVPEIVTHGTTGFVVASLADMIAAVAIVEQIDRLACRADVAARFSVCGSVPSACAEASVPERAALSPVASCPEQSCQRVLTSGRSDAQRHPRRQRKPAPHLRSALPDPGRLLPLGWPGEPWRRARISLRHLGGRALLLDGAGVEHRPPVPR
jgi:glycosyltransferase involved in cell wall biosynthesis